MRKGLNKKKSKRKTTLPIKHWSHSSLMAFLRNPLAWYKRYVEEIYDTPRTPASVVGSAGHFALEHFYRQMSEGQASAQHSSDRANAGGKPARKAYSGAPKDIAVQMGLNYLRAIADFEIDFGKMKSRRAQKEKRAAMEREYLQAIGFYLARAPRHKVLGVEVKGVVEVEGLPLPIKAVSDLVVESRIEKGAVDIVDHKFVASFSKAGAVKPLFIIQAIFNYYTVRALFGKPVRQFIVYECKKTKNADGSAQLRRYAIDFKKHREDFAVFHRLITDATEEITRRRAYLPNPSDMFEGDNSFDIYRLELLDE
ncbi:MAG: PD-(D/E)XK nuclease family protein [Candidatus Pacebacteria bacterium]|nr:PD-(D/E)XK nuclease family protein [Candidatus Paceibacterota bacterium]